MESGRPARSGRAARHLLCHPERSEGPVWRGGTLMLATDLVPPTHTDPSLPLGMTSAAAETPALLRKQRRRVLPQHFSLDNPPGAERAKVFDVLAKRRHARLRPVGSPQHLCRTAG